MISLIIPTYNRPNFLARLLRYYREQSFPHMIVVADSSFTPACKTNQNTVDSLQDVLSLHYELYRPDINPLLKIARALDTVDSKYVVICADDDFIIPRTIEQCACFLDANPDYSIAHGRVASIISQSSAYNGLHHDLRTSTYRQRTINCDTPQLRLKNHLKDYAPTFYSVHRRSDLIRNMELACDNTIDYRFGELLPSCLSLIQGKAKCLDILYMVRQSIPNSATEKTASWLSFLILDDFSQRYGRFRNCLAKELASVVGMSATEAKDVVNEAFLLYLARLLRSKPPAAESSFNALERIAKRVWEVVRIMPMATYSAFLDRQLVAMARSPCEAYRRLNIQRRERINMQRRKRMLLARQGDMSIDKLLDVRSPFHADFLRIYEYVRRYPNGVLYSQEEIKKK